MLTVTTGFSCREDVWEVQVQNKSNAPERTNAGILLLIMLIRIVLLCSNNVIFQIGNQAPAIIHSDVYIRMAYRIHLPNVMDSMTNH